MKSILDPFGNLVLSKNTGVLLGPLAHNKVLKFNRDLLGSPNVSTLPQTSEPHSANLSHSPSRGVELFTIHCSLHRHFEDHWLPVGVVFYELLSLAWHTEPLRGSPHVSLLVG